MAKKRPSRQQLYHRRQVRIKAERADAFRASFADWPEQAADYRREVQRAMDARPTSVLGFRKQLDRPLTYPTVDAMALTLRAVEALGESRRGLSVTRLGEAFKVAGIGWQRALGSACLKSLVALGLIRQTAGHSKGNRGRMFAVLREPPKPLPEWIP